MPTMDPIMLLVAGLGLIGLLAIVIIWPQAGFIYFLGTPVVKLACRSYMPFLVGYTMDMVMISISFIGIAWHGLRVGGSFRNLAPRGFMVAWGILMVLVWIMIPFSRNTDYGVKKALMFSIFATLSTLLPLMYFKRLQDAKGLMWACAMVGLATMATLLLSPSMAMDAGGYSTTGRATVLDVCPLAPADFCTYLILILLGLWVAQRRRWQMVAVLLLVPTGVYSIILTGTRGPVFAIPIVLAVILYIYRRAINVLFVVSSVVVLTLVVVATIAVISPDLTTRWQSKYLVEGIESREYMLRVMVDNWLSNPILGNGTGDTAYQISGPNVEIYPHNLLLEIASELGLPGLTCLLVLFGYGIKAGIRLCRADMEGTYAKSMTVPFLGCYAYHFLCSFKTGTYAAAFNLYFFLACTIALLQLWDAEQGRTAGFRRSPGLR